MLHDNRQTDMMKVIVTFCIFVNTLNNPVQWHTATCYSHMGCYDKKANRTLQLISFQTAVTVAVSDGMVDNGLHIHSVLQTPT